MSSKLELILLGEPQVVLDGVPVNGFVSSKVQALLIYLAVTGRPHRRTALTALFWGDMKESSARANLRQALSNLRRLVGEFLDIDRQTVAFRHDTGCRIDVAELERGMAAGTTATGIDFLQVAANLYQGDFLEGFSVLGAPDFESWALGVRARLRELALNVLDTLAYRFARQGELEQAIAYRRRLLHLEPWREADHRLLMELLAKDGQHRAALAQYERCTRILLEELGIEPGSATRELYERLLQNQSVQANGGGRRDGAIASVPFLGRQHEVHQLLSTLRAVAQSGSRFVCITGEAGIGKTRLCDELAHIAEQENCATAHTRAYALQGRLAYGPVAAWLRTETLQRSLHELDNVWLSEVSRLLPELLSQHPEIPHPEPLRGGQKPKQLFEALLQAFTRSQQPLLLVLNDLQWCDPGTLEWLHYLLSGAAAARLLVVGTVRLEEVDDGHPLKKLRRVLQAEAKLTEIHLGPLSENQTKMLAGQVAGGELEPHLADRIYRETAGNPLFIIETVRAGNGLWGRADAAEERVISAPPSPAAARSEARSLPIPPKVYSVIQLRLVQLSPQARTLAHLAATIGRSFTVDLLVQASNQDEEVVVDGIEELWQRGIIGKQDAGRYDFSHDRIRDVAYAGISPIQRRLFHRRVAEALERSPADDLIPLTGELGAHYERAGLLKEAVRCYRLAAGMAK